MSILSERCTLPLLRGATPLLCETKSWVTRSKSSDNVDRSSAAWIRMPWPRLKCCDSHDYCNADHRINVSTWIHDKETPDAVEPTLGYTGKESFATFVYLQWLAELFVHVQKRIFLRIYTDILNNTILWIFRYFEYICILRASYVSRRYVVSRL